MPSTVFSIRTARVDGAVSQGETWDDRFSLDPLLLSSDVVSVHLPLTSETRYLIDRCALAHALAGAVHHAASGLQLVICKMTLGRTVA
jgi:phosphoglycerate dehydrogenase-like enzyme